VTQAHLHSYEKSTKALSFFHFSLYITYDNYHEAARSATMLVFSLVTVAPGVFGIF